MITMSATTLPLAIFDIGGPEVLLIMLVALLLFGSQRLPDLARSLGKSIHEFKKATSGLEEEFRRAMEAPPPPAPPPRPPAPPVAPPAPVNPPAAAAPAVPPAPPPPDEHSDA
jgi:sec-independent protein translocase protein TatA